QRRKIALMNFGQRHAHPDIGRQPGFQPDDRRTFVDLNAYFRREIYRELGISLYSNEAAEEAGLRWAQHYEFLSHQMAQQLG
ncbi:hypothetical protein ACSLOI_28520, partial [Escherichia coli]